MDTKWAIGIFLVFIQTNVLNTQINLHTIRFQVGQLG